MLQDFLVLEAVAVNRISGDPWYPLSSSGSSGNCHQMTINFSYSAVM